MHDDVRRRLRNQRLTGPGFERPGEVVSWLGAVQAEDYAGAKWAVGQRMAAATDARLDDALDTGEILRTHILRPTWHFVTPADIRWIQALTAPRVHQLNRSMYRKLELDADTLARTASLITGMLAGGNHLTREEIGTRLAGHGIAARGQRLAYIVMHAELEALICSGPRKGKRHSYALVDERAVPMPALHRDEAVARLTWRFFTSHGPASAYDFAWWAGLTVGDARRGAATATGLESVEFNGTTWWAGPDAETSTIPRPCLHLLPNYDEFFSRDTRRSPYPDRERERKGAEAAAGRLLVHHVVIDGAWRGGWRRHLGASSVTVELDPSDAYTAGERDAITTATARYGRFLGMPASVA
jgi:hypothetical protein